MRVFTPLSPVLLVLLAVSPLAAQATSDYNALCTVASGTTPASGSGVPSGLTTKEYAKLKAELSQTLAQKSLKMGDLAGKIGEFKTLLKPEAQCLFEKDSTFMALLCGGNPNCDVGDVLATMMQASTSGPLAAIDDFTGFGLAFANELGAVDWTSTNSSSFDVASIFDIVAKALSEHGLVSVRMCVKGEARFPLPPPITPPPVTPPPPPALFFLLLVRSLTPTAAPPALRSPRPCSVLGLFLRLPPPYV